MPRARDIFEIPGTTGPLNHIADLKNLEIGHLSLRQKRISKGRGPDLCTGLSVIFPKGKECAGEKLRAGVYVLNGNGEVTGLSYVNEVGLLEGPIVFTNTFAVGQVSNLLRQWMRNRYPEANEDDVFMGLPLVGETYDGCLNDIDAVEVFKKDAVFKAFESAKTKNSQEGDVGGGSGMMSFAFKSGIGSASRLISFAKERFTLGVIVQSNFGKREDFRPFGRTFKKDFYEKDMPNFFKKKDGSILSLIVTDAPMNQRQLERLAKRSSLGMAQVGGLARHGSGDFFIAVSTESVKIDKAGFDVSRTIPNDKLDVFFEAAASATSEAILNSLLASKDTISGDRKVFSLKTKSIQV